MALTSEKIRLLLDKARNIKEAKSVMSKIMAFISKKLVSVDSLVTASNRLETLALTSIKVSRTGKLKKSGVKISDTTYIPPTAAEMKMIKEQWSVLASSYALLEDIEDVHLPRLYNEYGKQAKVLFASVELELKKLKTKVNDALKAVQQYGKKRPPKLVTKVISDTQEKLVSLLNGRFKTPMTTRVYVGLAPDSGNPKDKTLAFFYYLNFENFKTDTGNTYPDWYVVITAIVNEDGDITFKANVTGKFLMPTDIDLDPDQMLSTPDSIVEEVEKEFFTIHAMNVLRPLTLPVDKKVLENKTGVLKSNKYVDTVNVVDDRLILKLTASVKAKDVDTVLQEILILIKGLFGMTAKDKRIVAYTKDTKGQQQVIIVSLHAIPGGTLDTNVNYKHMRDTLKTNLNFKDDDVDDVIQLINRKRRGSRK